MKINKNEVVKLIVDFVLKYIFCFVFIIVASSIFKLQKMDIETALSIAFGLVFYDVVKYIFTNFKSKKTNT
jgi:hypothetical protein